jgi:hypothetical protein
MHKTCLLNVRRLILMIKLSIFMSIAANITLNMDGMRIGTASQSLIKSKERELNKFPVFESRAACLTRREKVGIWSIPAFS